MEDYNQLTDEENEVERATAARILVPARSLAADLGQARESYLERFIEIALGQYQLALEQRAEKWIDDFRRAAQLYLPPEMIQRRFPRVEIPVTGSGPIFALPRKENTKGRDRESREDLRLKLNDTRYQKAHTDGPRNRQSSRDRCDSRFDSRPKDQMNWQPGRDRSQRDSRSDRTGQNPR